MLMNSWHCGSSLCTFKAHKRLRRLKRCNLPANQILRIWSFRYNYSLSARQLLDKPPQHGQHGRSSVSSAKEAVGSCETGKMLTTTYRVLLDYCISCTLLYLMQVTSGDTVVIRGQPRGGPPPEILLCFSNVFAPKLARKGQAEESDDEVCTATYYRCLISNSAWRHCVYSSSQR